MAKKLQKTQRDFKHVWYVREWLRLAGKKQADLQRDLGWSKAKSSDVWNGQQYNQTIIDELAPYVHAEPFELLMSPEQAMALRQLRSSALRIAADSQNLAIPAAAPVSRPEDDADEPLKRKRA
jgi:hypothetical protein